MIALALLTQLAVDDRVREEIDRFCAAAPAAERARCVVRQRADAKRTFDAARIGDDSTPAAIGLCLERSRARGAIDWSRAAACAENHARANPAFDPQR